MINLWFLWFLQDCYENSCNLELAHAHSGQLRGESLTEAVWTLIELCLRSRESILKPRAS
jgi:hypothetical protein